MTRLLRVSSRYWRVASSRARRAVGGRDGVPNRIRTGVAAVKGRCPRPLDDGDGVLVAATVYPRPLGKSTAATGFALDTIAGGMISGAPLRFSRQPAERRANCRRFRLARL